MFTYSQKTLGILFALVTACGLGAITTQAKVVYADGGNALTLMLIRFLASSIVFGGLILLRGDKFKVERTNVRSLFGLGIFWSGVMICYLLSVESISVSLAVLILYTYPMLVLIYSIVKN